MFDQGFVAPQHQTLVDAANARAAATGENHNCYVVGIKCHSERGRILLPGTVAVWLVYYRWKKDTSPFFKRDLIPMLLN